MTKITKDTISMREKLTLLIMKRDFEGSQDFVGDIITLFQKEKDEALREQAKRIVKTIDTHRMRINGMSAALTVDATIELIKEKYLSPSKKGEGE